MADKETIGIVGTAAWARRWCGISSSTAIAVVAQDIEPKAVRGGARAGRRDREDPGRGRQAPARFVIVAVGYDDEAEAVMLGGGGLLETMGAGSVIAVSSTCTPEHVRMLGERRAPRASRCSTRRSAAARWPPTTAPC